MRACSRKIAIVAVAAAGLLILTASADATTLQVSTTGTDSPTCGPVTPCLTIQQAVTNSVTNDTVQIGAGTFTVKNITVGNKNLAITGAGNGTGAGATIIDGADATDAAGQGAFRFNGNGTTSTISNMTFQHLARTNATASTPGRAIFVQPSTAGNSTSVTISNVDVYGSSPAVTPAVTALGSSVNTGTLSVNNVHTFALNGNSLLLERHRGPATVQNSSFEQANFGYAIYDFSYGGAPAEVTGAHSFTDNTISGPNGIFVNAGFASAPLAESSYLGQITISNNTYSSPVSSGIAIRLENSPVGAASSVATMDLVSITGNSAIGNGAAGVGVQLTGKIAGSVIAKNNIRGFATAVELANSSRSPADAPSGTQVNRNQIVDNGGAAKSGLATGSAVTGVNAANNWWGCNAGPPVGAAAQVSDCDSAVLANTGSAAVEPHMLLAITADQSTLGNSASSSVTGAITQNSQGDSVPVVIPDGTPYLFSGTGGSVSASSAPTTAGAAGVVFTSAAPTGRSASVTYDHQTVTHTWPDNDAAPPVITITSPANRSIVDQPTITLNYTVNEGATCTPPPGSKVDLNVGVNTIVVTCTDANGNVSTASVQVVRPDALPACAASVVITNVRRSGSRSVVSGFARLRFAGQKISLRYMPSGSRTIARPTVRSNGSWTATVNRPKRPSYKSNDARYRAVLGSTKTRWIKLTRRMGSTTVTSASTGALSVKGSVSKPLAPGQRVRVERSDACGKYRQIGSVSVRRSGSFSGKVSDGGSSDVAVFIRLKLRVRSSSGTRFNTYSIVQPVILKR